MFVFRYPVLISAVLLLVCCSEKGKDSPVDNESDTADAQIAQDVADVPVPDDTDSDSDLPNDTSDNDVEQDIEEVAMGDPGQPRSVGNGAVGQACYLDDHCDDDSLCLDWSEGYCTVLNCPALNDCPDGSRCVDAGVGTTLCLAECESQSDCRDQYGCKTFTDLDGEIFSGCFELNEPASPVGGTCEKHADCDGAAACLTFVDEGYCAVVGCSDEQPCSEGAKCVVFNGAATCLKECSVLDDCMVGDAKQRVCAPLLTIKSEPADVCIPAVGGVGVGSQCTSNIECVSNECRIVAEGKCVGSDQGCFENDDCLAAGICEKAPAYVKGICTQSCAGDKACPGNSVCVDSGGSSAWCQVPCSGLDDTQECDANLGESCVFGDPLVGSGGGKYVCVVFKPGEAGATCKEDAECKAPKCITKEDSSGVCAPECAADLACPFPTTCVDHDGTLRCMKRCFFALDCPSGMKCKTTGTSNQKICVH